MVGNKEGGVRFKTETRERTEREGKVFKEKQRGKETNQWKGVTKGGKQFIMSVVHIQEERERVGETRRQVFRKTIYE